MADPTQRNCGRFWRFDDGYVLAASAHDARLMKKAPGSRIHADRAADRRRGDWHHRGDRIPGLLRARMAGNEASAIASLRAVNSSQHAYMSSCGNGFYASSLLILADPAPVGAAFISPDLGAAAVIDKSGYRLTMEEGSEATARTSDGCNPQRHRRESLTAPTTRRTTDRRRSDRHALVLDQRARRAVYLDADDFAAEHIGNARPRRRRARCSSSRPHAPAHPLR